MSYWFFLFFRI